MTTLKSVFVPDIGDFKEIPVIEVLVKPGDMVEAEDSIITLESDKATMEVPAPAKGVVKEIKVNPGDTVSEGSLILSMESPNAEKLPQEKIESPSTKSSIGRGAEVTKSPEAKPGSEHSGKARETTFLQTFLNQHKLILVRDHTQVQALENLRAN